MPFSRNFRSALVAAAIGAAGMAFALPARGQEPSAPACPRPSAGGIVPEPEDLRSKSGVLRVELAYRKSPAANGSARYCYIAPDGSEAPTLRVKPGDLVIFRLTNETPADPALGPPAAAAAHRMPMPAECAGAEMTASATNVHFHGLDLPPVCHQDDVLNTIIEPGARPFEYRFRVPAAQPPGLYWYHPHLHGFTKAQVLGGASGALIVEGIERADAMLAGLPERVFVIRDQDLEHPDAQAAGSSDAPAPVVTRDAEGDILNAGMDGGKPAKDLSINFVPVSFPDYTPALIRIRPGERQLWRVLNASAITYMDLQLVANAAPQFLGVISFDGTPIRDNGIDGGHVLWQSHILLPPAGRVEFIMKPFPEGQTAAFVTRVVDTGPAGENDPTRTLATIVASSDAPAARSRLAASPAPLKPAPAVWLGDAAPARTRTLYFSETPRNPSDPNSPTDFYLTVEGQKPALFDPASRVPNIVAKEGEVEDWIIENRTRELHAFHIHQIHFMLLAWNGVPVREPFLRDTLNVGYWDGVSKSYPSVKLRMDFRDPNAVGTFVYHCHLLEHEDGGMMGLIRVEPRAHAGKRPSHASLAGRNSPLCGRPASLASVRLRSQRPVTGVSKNSNGAASPPGHRKKNSAREVFNGRVITR